ncbi:MAG: SGNH/GDSL hydrolase family protein [Candidatus Omnitrophota bacterium]
MYQCIRWNIERHTNLFQNHTYNTSEIFFNPKNEYKIKHIVRKPSDTVRIICLGTSSTQGWPNAISYPQILEELLKKNLKQKNLKNSKTYEVINAGVGGYNSFKVLIYFKDILLKFNPDIVTLYLGSNDSNYPSCNNLTDKDVYEYIKTSVNKYPSVNSNYNLTTFLSLSPFVANDVTYKILKQLYKSRLFFAVSNGVGYLKNKIKNKNVMEVPPDLFKEVLTEFVTLAKNNNFTLVIIPEAHSLSEPEILQQISIMEEIASRYNIRLIDVQSVLRRSRDKKVFHDYVHPTVLGHKIIAQEIYESLVATYPVLFSELPKISNRNDNKV